MESDLASEYRLDVESHEFDRMSWRRLAILIHGLMVVDSRLYRSFQPADDKAEKGR